MGSHGDKSILRCSNKAIRYHYKTAVVDGYVSNKRI